MTQSALALDFNSPAVTGAYAGAADPDKLAAAWQGLDELQAALAGATDGTFSSVDSIWIFVFSPSSPFDPLAPFTSATLNAAADADLGAPGDPLLLDATRLNVLASFTSSRAVTIASGGTNIDTGAFTLTLDGTLSVNGKLFKQGSGVLALFGSTTWNEMPFISDGTLRGDAASLASDISTSLLNPTMVEFAQAGLGIYAGRLLGGGTLHKTGAGNLTLTARSPYGGGTTVSAGTLALGATGLIGNGPLAIAAGAVFDLSSARTDAANPLTLEVGAVSGAGSVLLGPNYLQTQLSADSIFSGVISGVGGLVVESASGHGLTLTAAQTYQGTTVLDSAGLRLVGAGALSAVSDVSVDVDSAFDISGADGDREIAGLDGSGVVELGTRTLTFGMANAPRSFAGTVSGSGGLRKVGASRQQLWGTAAYTGLTRIDGGILAVKPAALGSAVINDAELEFEFFAADDPAQPLAAYSGSISGSGEVSKTGDGVVWLRGTNSYSGGTHVRGGVLMGNTASLQGDLAIESTASAAFYQIADGGYSGTINGAGSLFKFGPGRVHLTGINQHAGGTAFSGPLRIDSDANLGAPDALLVLADGALELAASTASARPLFLFGDNAIDTRGFNLTLSGPGNGTGTLTKRGAGALVLEGNYAHAGLTAVAAGHLHLAGALGGPLAVASGAGLSGGGSIAGDLVLAPGSAYQVAVDAAGNATHVNVTAGSASIADSALAISAAAGDYAASTRYTVLSARDGIVGSFATVSTDLALLTPALQYEENRIELTLTRNELGYGAFALSTDQRSIAEALEQLGAAGDGAEVHAAFATLTAAEIPVALEALGGVALNGVPRALQVQQRALSRQLSTRLSTLGSDAPSSVSSTEFALGMLHALSVGGLDAPLPLYAAALGAADTSGPQASVAHGLWLRGLGGLGEFEVTQADAAELRGAGVIAGFDWPVLDVLTVGFYSAYTDSDLEQDAPASDLSVQSWRVGGYGRWQRARWTVDATFGYGQDDFATRRQITFGPLTRVVHGDFGGESYNAYLELDYAVPGELTAVVTVQPYAALQWTTQQQDAYTESGGGALDLALRTNTTDSLRTLAGARLRHGFATTSTWSLSMDVHAAWAHELANQGAVSARFAGDVTGTIFRVRGQQVPRDSAVFGAGIAAQAAHGLRFFADVDAELNGAQRAIGFGAGLRYAW